MLSIAIASKMCKLSVQSRYGGWWLKDFFLKSLKADDDEQVQELQPLHKSRDETDQRRLIDEVNFVDGQTATTSRTLGITRY